MDTANSSTELAASSRPTYQFRLWHLLYITTFLAVSLALSRLLLAFAVGWVTICWLSSLGNTREDRVETFRSFIIVGAMIGFLWSLGSPVIGSRDASERSVCLNNLRQVMLALGNYEIEEGEFPEAQILDSDGKPMHSWRVLILPYLEERALYEQYDFDQPWDSPSNLKLVEQMPGIYGCPCQKHRGLTQYKLVVGEGSLFDGGSRTYGRITDGGSNTIALVEDSANPVEWTRPSDVTIEEALAVLKPKDADGLPHVVESFIEKSYFAGNCARFDGSVLYTWVHELKDEEVRKCLGIADGLPDETNVDPDYQLPQRTVFKLSPTFAAAIFLALMAIPVVWVFRDDRETVTKEAS